MTAQRNVLAWVAAAAVGGSLAGCATTPPEQDPVQIRLKDLDSRITRIERLMTNQGLLELANEMEALRADVRGVHDSLDKEQNERELGRKRLHDVYLDLDARIKALEVREATVGAVAADPAAAPAAGPQSAPAADAGAPPVAAQRPAALAAAPGADGSDRGDYQAAFALLKDSQYDRATAAFSKFLVDHPDSALADNAQYWLGEAYYVNREFPAALTAFQRVLDRYPQSRKLPDALLKVGYCNYELGKWDLAKAALKQVTANYADTPAGHLAQLRLEKIQAENH
jgi:tol-pal system protein YbgF